MPAIWLVLTLPRGSAGSAITVFTALIALAFLGFVVVMVKFFSR